jgi:hypothetical protein
MNSAMQGSGCGETNRLSATESRQVPPVTDSSGSFILLLVPHVAAALLIWAMIAVTLTGAWTAMRMTLSATTGPVMSSVLLAAGACGVMSLGTIWWFCSRGSQSRARQSRADTPAGTRESDSRRIHAA